MIKARTEKMGTETMIKGFVWGDDSIGYAPRHEVDTVAVGKRIYASNRQRVGEEDAE